MISLRCRERRSSWCWLNSQCHKAEAGRGWRDNLEPELTRTCLWLPGEGDPHSGATTSCEEKHLSKVRQECPSVSLALLVEALVAPKGPQVMWADRHLSVGSRLAQAQAAPCFPLCLCSEPFSCGSSQLSTSPLHPPLLLSAVGTTKPISILIIQKGYAKYCSHIVYENIQDIYYISGGRTGSLIASAGCKLQKSF